MIPAAAHRLGRLGATFSLLVAGYAVAAERVAEQISIDDPLRARPIWVVGEVVRSGALDHHFGLTMADALAASGGPGPAAWRERIVVRAGGANRPGVSVDPDGALRPGTWSRCRLGSTEGSGHPGIK